MFGSCTIDTVIGDFCISPDLCPGRAKLGGVLVSKVGTRCRASRPSSSSALPTKSGHYPKLHHSANWQWIGEAFLFPGLLTFLAPPARR